MSSSNRSLPAQLTPLDDVGERWSLNAPRLGRFTAALTRGARVEAGMVLGALEVLHARYTIIAPEGVCGRIVDLPTTRRGASVEWGAPLAELRAVGGDDAGPGSFTSLARASGLEDLPEGAEVFCAPMDGLFYHRSSPDDPPFIKAGATLEPGDTLGLIEVMKFFYPVEYEGRRPVRVEQILVGDASPIESGQPLLVLVPCDAPSSVDP